MAVKFLDLTGLQKFWTKCKNAFLAKDSEGAVSIDGSMQVKGASTFEDSVDIAHGNGLTLWNEDNTKGSAVFGSSDGSTICVGNNQLATQAYVNSAVANAGHLKREKVSTLPGVASAKENVIYMVPISGASGEDTFDEYMLIDNKLEKMGSSRIDLSGYSTTAQMNTAISTAITNAHTAITETEINNLT